MVALSARMIEKGEISFGVFVPDSPGYVAMGDTEEDVCQLIAKVIALHLEGMLENGEANPEPLSQVEYVGVKTVHDGYVLRLRRRHFVDERVEPKTHQGPTEGGKPP